MEKLYVQTKQVKTNNLVKGKLIMHLEIKVLKDNNKNEYTHIKLPSQCLEEEINEFVGTDSYSMQFNKNIQSKVNLSIVDINLMAEKLEKYNTALVEVIYEYLGCFYQTYVTLEEHRYLYSYNMQSLEEVAEELLELGIFGVNYLSEEVKYSYDYKSIANDLEKQGWRVINNIALLAY